MFKRKKPDATLQDDEKNIADEVIEKKADDKEVSPPPPLSPGYSIAMRTDWYRDNFRRSVALNILLGMISVGLGLTANYFYHYVPDPEYFAINRDGSLIPIIPLHHPNYTDIEVTNFASASITETLDFTWINYERHIEQSCRDAFTLRGCNQFIDALKRAKTIEAITKHKLVLSATPTSVPVIRSKKVNADGVYEWEIVMNVLITYRSESKQYSENNEMVIIIKRVSTKESRHGKGIDNFQIRKSSSVQENL